MNEVYTALFHKMVIDGKTYYQCRLVVPAFTPNERFDSLTNRMQSNKNDFFITAKMADLKSKGINEDTIFVESDGLRIVTDNRLFDYVKGRFANEYKEKKETGSHPQALIDAYVNRIVEDSKCHKGVIKQIISTIVYNRELNKSSLTKLTKNMHHDNIVMFGPLGSGDDIILESLKRNLQIPVIELTLTGDIDCDIETLAHKIEENNKEFNGNALVLVDCDFNSFSQKFEGDTFYPLRQLVHYGGTYKSPYMKNPINFHDLTYLMNINVSGAMMNIDDLENYFIQLTGCTKAIALKKLSMTQIRKIIYDSTYSVVKYCEETAKKYNREFLINKQAITDAIKFISFFDGHVAMLNSAILESFKEQLERGYGKITIGREILGYIQNIIEIEMPPMETAPDNKVMEEKEEEDNLSPENRNKVDEITSEILKTIRGQDRQVRRIVKNVLKNLEYANDDNITSPEKRKKNILIRGDSGTGKTEIIRCLAKVINVPMVVADATQYTEEGYVGDSVNEMLLDLYREAGGDLHKAERGILVIDEIDKKASNNGDRSDVSRKAVLQGLLKIVEGTKKRIKYEEALPTGAVIKKKLDFDTNRLTIICLGAFENLETFRDERIRKATKPKSMGFRLNDEEDKKNEVQVNRNFTNEDYEAYGMGNQFIPRFKNKVYLNKLTKDMMIDIMKNSITSPIRMIKEDYLRDGIILEFTEDFYEKLAEIAITKSSGARGIDEALEDTIDLLGLNDLNTSLYSKIIINGECINNPEALVLISRDKVKIKR